MNNKYCGNCSGLNVTEEQQLKMRIKPNHFCKRFKKVVLHRDEYPKLPKLDECIKEAENYKNKKSKNK